jgi:hypothetical protein
VAEDGDDGGEVNSVVCLDSGHTTSSTSPERYSTGASSRLLYRIGGEGWTSPTRGESAVFPPAVDIGHVHRCSPSFMACDADTPMSKLPASCWTWGAVGWTARGIPTLGPASIEEPLVQFATGGSHGVGD